MVETFVNREKELAMLREEMHKGRASLIVIYGRRRVGKTELVKKIIKKDTIYIYIPNQSKESLYSFLAEALYQQNKDPMLIDFKFKNLNQFFEYLKNKGYKEIILDEFQRLEREKGSLSILQHHWDEHFSKNKVKIILLGSSISMTQKLILSYNGPLFGRRTLEMFIEPFDLKGVMQWFKNYDIKDIIRIYSVFGGTPAYLQHYDTSLSLIQNIEHNILTKGKLLYNEVEQLLNIETREPGTYLNILKQISLGKTRLNDLFNKTGIERTKLSFYLNVLQKDLTLIKKQCPITEDPIKSKKGIYMLDDPYFIFWLRFVFRNISNVEEGRIGNVIDIINRDIDKHIGLIFENICKNTLKKTNAPFNFEKIGRWWDKEKEIDIAALNEKTKEIIFCECKWKDNVDAEKILAELKEKTKSVKWNNDIRKEYYAIFAKSFKKKIKNQNIQLFDLKDIQNIINT